MGKINKSSVTNENVATVTYAELDQISELCIKFESGLFPRASYISELRKIFGPRYDPDEPVYLDIVPEK